MAKRHVTGSLRARPNKDNIRYYDIVLEFGTNPITGKRERTTFRAETTDREEAENMLICKKAEYLSGELLMPCDMTVKDFLEEYMRDYVRTQTTASTVRDYQGIIDRYLIPEFGNIKLQNLQQSRIQQVYNGWTVKSSASDKPLSINTIKHINRVFKAALNVACDFEYIKRNPTRKVRIKKDMSDRKKALEVYTTQEILDLKNAVRGTDMELPVTLLFDCLMRRGELLGLCFKDVELNEKESKIYIRQSWVETEDSKAPVLKDCKTDNSNRCVVISKETARLLRAQKRKCQEICLREGKPFTGDQRVICKENGDPYLPKSFYQKWRRTLKKYNLRYIKLHGTRHSGISWMLSKGIPLQIVQERAGHSDPKITLSVYSHVAKDEANRVAKLLDDELFPLAGS